MTEKYSIEGSLNYVFFAYSELKENPDGTSGINKYFMTQSDGTNTARCLSGVFDSVRIPNDLSYVIKKIEEYDNGDD